MGTELTVLISINSSLTSTDRYSASGMIAVFIGRKS